MKPTGTRPVGTQSHLNRAVTARRPNARWVTNSTAIRTTEHRLYLRIILDLYSGLVVEFATGSAPRQTGSATATEWIPVILQSDRGCQFTSKVCQYFLATCHIMCGKSVVGSCAGNAAAESYLGAKRERVHQPQHRTRVEVREDIFD